MLRRVGIVVGCKKQGGFTLLEVLVAMIVMAIGLLGLASLQAVSLARGNDSLLRQQAAMLAYDIADRMRANLGGVRDPDNSDKSSYHMTIITPPTTANGVVGPVTCPCTPAQMAANDLDEWINGQLIGGVRQPNGVSTVLPGGTAIVCIDNNPDPPATPATPAAPQCDTPAGSASPSNTVYAIKIWWTEKERDSVGGVSEKLFVMSFRP
jgi:type IV pilus assembly protein PilV